jgi:hypothetical protein
MDLSNFVLQPKVIPLIVVGLEGDLFFEGGVQQCYATITKYNCQHRSHFNSSTLFAL